MINKLKELFNKKSERNSAIELLRIIAMFMIIISHYSVHGVIDSNALSFSLNKIVLQASVLGNLGVAIFVIITGYFSIKNSFSIKRLLYLYFQVWFYSVIIYLLLVVFGLSSFNIKELIKCIFPLLFIDYWFMTAYFLLMIFTPFLNKLLNSITKSQYVVFLSLLIFIWFVIPTFFRQEMYGGAFMLFVSYYSLGSYVRLYKNDFKRDKKKYILFSIISALILLASIISINYINIGAGTAFLSSNSMFILVLALFIFISFTKIKPFNNNLTNKVSACTLGIYLIHDNNYIRPLLWKSMVKNNLVINSPFLFLDIIKWGIIVFVVCTLIELIRINFIHKPLVNVIDKYIDKIFNKIKNVFDKFVTYLISKE